MFKIIFVTFLMLTIMSKGIPENIGDLDRLVYYYQENVIWYIKPFEIVTKFYFTQIPKLVVSSELFKLLTALLCYLPLLYLVDKCKYRENQFISLILLCVCVDVGHTLQFARTYLVLNLLILILVNFQRRHWLGISSISIHQGIGSIYFFYSLIKVIRTGKLIMVVLLISVIYVFTIINLEKIISQIEYFRHSFWIFDSEEYFKNLNKLLLPKLLIMLACQCIITLITWGAASISLLSLLVFSILLVLSGFFGEIMFRIICYALEIIFPLQFILIKRRIKFVI